MFNVIVVGKGLLGSAALRYLSEATGNVAIVGPDEPPDYASHRGVFASHYDEGRLAGRLGRDLVWARLTAEAMKKFSRIEQQTGIHFHVPCGRLMIVLATEASRYFQQRRLIARSLNVLPQVLSTREVRERFQMIEFSTEYRVAFEPAPAGLIRPRALIRAQLAASIQNGATILCEEVRTVQADADGVRVITQNGQKLYAGRVLLASGAFTNFHELLKRHLALRVKTETVFHAEVSENEVARLGDMPTVSYEIESSVLDGIYLTPPLRYPDGRFYIKVGCNTTTDEALKDLAAIHRWMSKGRADGAGVAMLHALRDLIPRIDVRSWQARPCLESYTPHGKPFVDQLSEQVFVAAGGNGSAAQCSDTLGYLAAGLLLDQSWPHPWRREDFRAVYADETIEHIVSPQYASLQ